MRICEIDALPALTTRSEKNRPGLDRLVALIHAKVKTVQVAVSMETKRSRPLTEPERTFLARYLKA